VSGRTHTLAKRTMLNAILKTDIPPRVVSRSSQSPKRGVKVTARLRRMEATYDSARPFAIPDAPRSTEEGGKRSGPSRSLYRMFNRPTRTGSTFVM